MNSEIWMKKQSAGSRQGSKSPGTVAMTMTEDTKTGKNTAGSLCGTYIDSLKKISRKHNK